MLQQLLSKLVEDSGGIKLEPDQRSQHPSQLTNTGVERSVSRHSGFRS